jgi:hypothetical protein
MDGTLVALGAQVRRATAPEQQAVPEAKRIPPVHRAAAVAVVVARV